MKERKNGRYDLFQKEIRGQLSQMEKERSKGRFQGRSIGLLGIVLALGLICSIFIRFWMGV